MVVAYQANVIAVYQANVAVEYKVSEGTTRGQGVSVPGQRDREPSQQHGSNEWVTKSSSFIHRKPIKGDQR
jgi:hypothetical protein